MADRGSDRTRPGHILARGWDHLLHKLVQDRRWQAGFTITLALLLGLLAYWVRTSAPARVDVIGVLDRGSQPRVAASGPAGAETPALASLRQHSRFLSTVVVPAYTLGPRGQVAREGAAAGVERLARSQRLKVWAGVGGRDGTTLAELLRHTAALEEGAENLAREVARAGYDGVNLDLRPLEPRDGPGLTRFVSLLRRGLKPTTTLAVSVPPKVDLPREAHGAYDYAALAERADYLVLLAFDRHQAAGPPGPVSPLSWVEDGIRYALSHGVPGRRLILAAGADGYDWPLDGSPGRRLGARGALDLARGRGVRPDLDPESHNPFFFYGPPGARRLVWYQDRVVAGQRVRLVKTYGLHGVALWGLGSEDPAAWAEVWRELQMHPTAPLPRPPGPEAGVEAALAICRRPTRRRSACCRPVRRRHPRPACSPAHSSPVHLPLVCLLPVYLPPAESVNTLPRWRTRRLPKSSTHLRATGKDTLRSPASIR